MDLIVELRCIEKIAIFNAMAIFGTLVTLLGVAGHAVALSQWETNRYDSQTPFRCSLKEGEPCITVTFMTSWFKANAF